MIGQLPSTPDALVMFGVAIAVYLAMVGVAQIVRRAWKVTFRVTFHLLAIVVGLLAGIGVSSWRTAAESGLQRHLSALALLLAAFPVITLVNRLLWKRTGRGAGTDAPRVLADTTTILVWLAAVLLVLQYVYGVRVPGLLAGSGVVALIIGLALQTLLGNLLAGMALHFERPFSTGDWLLVDDMHGRVVEVSWRSTRLVTTDDVLIDVPNSQIVSNTITNFANPTPRHAVHATIGLHYDVPPARAQRVLARAAASVAGIAGSGTRRVREGVRRFVDHVQREGVDRRSATIFRQVLSDLRSHCWYAVTWPAWRFRSRSSPCTTRRPIERRRSRGPPRAARCRGNPIFSFLTAEQIEGLLRDSAFVLFSATEHVIDQGAEGDSMFLLVKGRVEVRRTRDGRTTVVAHLGAGDCFGEMSVLTGEPRSATVVAQDEVEAVEIPKTAFAALIRDNPDVVGRLSELLAKRQLANEQTTDAGSPAARTDETRASMLRACAASFSWGPEGRTGRRGLRAPGVFWTCL